MAGGSSSWTSQLSDEQNKKRNLFIENRLNSIDEVLTILLKYKINQTSQKIVKEVKSKIVLISGIKKSNGAFSTYDYYSTCIKAGFPKLVGKLPRKTKKELKLLVNQKNIVWYKDITL